MKGGRGDMNEGREGKREKTKDMNENQVCSSQLPGFSLKV